MFDSNLCDRTIEKVTVYTEWWQLQWLNKPLLIVVLILLAFFGFRWVIQHPRRRRWLSKPRTIVLLFCLTAIFPLLFVVADKGLLVFFPTDSGAPADAVVVLGRGWPLMHDRVNVAAELWQARRSPRIFASGRSDTPHLLQLLEEKGIPKQVLDGENCSLTTDENAIFTAAILQPQGIRRILLVTDSAHMLRSLLVFRAYGFTVIPYISPVPAHWNPKEKGILKLREYGGLVNYGLRGLLRPQHLSELKRPNLMNLVQEAQQYAQRRRLS